MPTSLVLLHIQDPQGRPLVARLDAASPNGDWHAQTNLCGDFPAELSPGHYDITVSAAGYASEVWPVEIENCGVITHALALAAPPAGSMARLSVQGNVFVLPDGTIYRPRYVTAFDLKALNNAYLQWARSIGANGVRVFGNWFVTGLDYRTDTNYWARVHDLAASLDVYNLRGEFTGLCDCQYPTSADPWGLGISPAEQREYLAQLADVLVAYPHMTIEEYNEPWKNGGIDGGITLARPGLLIARGSAPEATPPYTPSLGYTTIHQPRDAEWYRKIGKDCGVDIQAISKDVVWPNEPMKCSIDGDSANWRRAGYNAAMFCGAVTAHGNSDTLQRCVVPSAAEEACVTAMLDAAAVVPLAAPTWRYTRNGLNDMPVSNTDGRVYAKVDDAGGHACVLNMYDDQWTPQPQGDWRLTAHDGPYAELSR